MKDKVDQGKLQASKADKTKALTNNQIVTKNGKCDNTAGTEGKRTI